jgi:hypothetical protein
MLQRLPVTSWGTQQVFLELSGSAPDSNYCPSNPLHKLVPDYTFFHVLLEN